MVTYRETLLSWVFNFAMLKAWRNYLEKISNNKVRSQFLGDLLLRLRVLSLSSHLRTSQSGCENAYIAWYMGPQVSIKRNRKNLLSANVFWFQLRYAGQRVIGR